MLSNQHYQHRTNQKLRSWANAVFQNRGVCGQAFPSFPSPSLVIPCFCSRLNFLDELARKRFLRRLPLRMHFLISKSTLDGLKHVFNIFWRKQPVWNTSKEFHGIQFHGFPWNLYGGPWSVHGVSMEYSCSSMEFHGMPAWSSMEVVYYVER